MWSEGDVVLTESASVEVRDNGTQGALEQTTIPRTDSYVYYTCLQL